MTERAPISVALIVRDEIANLERCIGSIRPYVSEVCIVDTGSTDGTAELASRLADRFEVWTGCNDAEGRIADFAKARRRSFALASQPWVMWLDGDDEVIGGEHIPGLINDSGSQLSGMRRYFILPYDYAQDERGQSICVHWRERIVPRGAFRWVNPVHEVLAPNVPGLGCAACALEEGEKPPERIESFVPVQTDAVKILHHRQRIAKPRDPERNLRILRAHYERHGDADVRQLYYTGLEHSNVGDIRTSMEFHRRYVQRSGWDDEKALALLELAHHHRGFGEYQEAIRYALEATTVRELWCEPYFELGRNYHHLAANAGILSGDVKRNWERCVHFIRHGLSLPPTATILWTNPLERAHEIHRYLNVALNELGDLQGALASCETALQAVPDPELRGNAAQYREYLAKQQYDGAVDALLGLGRMSVETAKIAKSLLRGHYTVRRHTKGPKSLDVVIYTGPGLERWNPETAEHGGIGGSERMAIEMARRLVKRGHRVRVYGDCAGLEGFFDDVQYLDHTRYQAVTCDVLVASRAPEAVDGVQARVKLLWVHDVSCHDRLTPERAEQLDAILVLSQWHRDYFAATYPWLDPAKLKVTRNGIDTARFAEAVPRNPHKAVFSSSPDRGLDALLALWPRVRAEVTNAELHVFYGRANWERTARLYGSDEMLERAKGWSEKMASMRELGVHDRGMVSPAELAREMLSAGVWAYPTHDWAGPGAGETSCISAMEAQAAGLAIVTSPIAALVETVGNFGAMVEGDSSTELYQAEFAEHVVYSMRNTTEMNREWRAKQASRFCLDTLADEWSEMMLEMATAPKREAAE
jgi:glycosyltransferase involved in cell wall biosynthesis